MQQSSGHGKVRVATRKKAAGKSKNKTKRRWADRTKRFPAPDYVLGNGEER